MRPFLKSASKDTRAFFGHKPCVVSQYQNGQSMVEFLIIFPILALLTLGLFQLALIYNAKTTLNYAVFNAARAGAVNKAEKIMIDLALYRGLAPLFTSIDGNISDVQELQIGRDKIREIHEHGYICIERLSPSDSAFNDYGKGDDGAIPNNNLMYRTAQIGSSGVSIQDANLLKLRVTYCHKMIVPFFGRIIKKMSNGSDPDGISIAPAGNFQKNCYNNERIPIVSQAIVRMQSDAINDLFPASCK